MDKIDLTQTNAHFVDRLIELSRHHDVTAIDDIFASNGMKLLAKGMAVSPMLREGLLAHKLAKPIEASLAVSDGVSAEELGNVASEIAEQHPDLASLCGLGAGIKGTEGRDERRWWSLAYLRAVPLDAVSLLLLTLSRRDGGAPLRHAALVALIALGLARRLHLPHEAMEHLTTASLLHDVGELYLDPQVLVPDHPLSGDEWRSVVAHPAVGFKLLRDHAGLNIGVARAVLEHHERWDGSGYPRGVAGQDISLPGQILAAAEMTAGLLGKSQFAVHRTRVALNALSPGLAPVVLAALNEALSGLGQPSAGGDRSRELVIAELRGIATLLPGMDKTLSDTEVSCESVRSRELVVELEQRFRQIHQAFHRSGPGSLPLDDVVSLLCEPDAGELIDETADICDEIRWRVRELTRYAALRLGVLVEAERRHFERVVLALRVLE